MSQESVGVRQRAKGLVQQAKRSAGVGDPPLATEAGGRAEGMSEALRAFGEGDIDRFLDAFADDVQWSAPSGENVVVAFGAFVGEPTQGTRQLDEPGVQMWEFDGDKVVFVGISTDSAGFPAVVSEEEAKQREEKADEEESS